MSDFDCMKRAGEHYRCTFQGASILGECQPIDAPTPVPIAFGNKVIAGDSDDPSLLGWHVIVIVLIVVLTCAGGAFVLYWAATGSSDDQPLDMSTSLTDNMNGSNDDDMYASAMYSGVGDSSNAYAQGGNSMDGMMEFSCAVCGKVYNFESDLTTHVELRHGGGGGGGGTFDNGGTFMSGGGYGGY